MCTHLGILKELLRTIHNFLLCKKKEILNLKTILFCIYLFLKFEQGVLYIIEILSACLTTQKSTVIYLIINYLDSLVYNYVSKFLIKPMITSIQFVIMPI